MAGAVGRHGQGGGRRVGAAGGGQGGIQDLGRVQAGKAGPRGGDAHAAGDEHGAVPEQVGGVAGAGRSQVQDERAALAQWGCVGRLGWIQDLSRVDQLSGGVHASGHHDHPVGQEGARVAAAGGGQGQVLSLPGLGRIMDFDGVQGVAVGVHAAGQQDAAVREQSGTVSRAGGEQGVARLVEGSRDHGGAGHPTIELIVVAVGDGQLVVGERGHARGAGVRDGDLGLDEGGWGWIGE